MNIRTQLTALAAASVLMLPASAAAQNGGGMQSGDDLQITALQVQDAIEDELFFDPGVPSGQVTVSVLNGIATLTGTVDNLLAKERAARVTETVKGVESVVNRIVVRPAISRTANELRSDVVDALLNDPAADSYEIVVVADDSGNVTLSGTVDSWQERFLSERIAKSVAGVTHLDSRITVSPSRSRPDIEIKSDIEQALRWSILVDDGLIDVAVDDGEVTLTGTVGSAAEKRQARAKGWTAGVKSVDVDGLKVAEWARNDDLRQTKYVVRPDSEIQSAVERAIVYDPRVNSLNVDTNVDHGMVTLRGTVDSVKASRAAVADARNTVGVTTVKNRLKVKPEREHSDADLTRAVRSALTRHPLIERHEISVSVRNGTAYLYGMVDTYFEKGLADDVAARVDGVTAIENELSVRSHDWIGYSPFLEDPFIYGFDWYDYTPHHTWLTDLQIKENIESQLWWSPFVDADEVTVTVDDGVATLTGTVDTWSEYRAAAENAYEGGAVWVDNDLIVEMR